MKIVLVSGRVSIMLDSCATMGDIGHGGLHLVNRLRVGARGRFALAGADPAARSVGRFAL